MTNNMRIVVLIWWISSSYEVISWVFLWRVQNFI